MVHFVSSNYMKGPKGHAEEAEPNIKAGLRYDAIVELKTWLCELDERVSGEVASLRRFVFGFAVLVVVGAGLLVVLGWFKMRSDFSERDREISQHLAAATNQIETIGVKAGELKDRIEQLGAVQNLWTNKVISLSYGFAGSSMRTGMLAEQLQRLRTQSDDSARQLELLLQNVSLTTNSITEMDDRITQFESVSNQLAEVSRKVAEQSILVNGLVAIANRGKAIEMHTNLLSIMNNQSHQMSGQLTKLQTEIKALSSRIGKLESTEVLPEK